MSSGAETRPWSPLPGSLPAQPTTDHIYLLPTRARIEGEAGTVPLYAESVRQSPKVARASGVPMEFSLPPEDREFLSEYSDVEAWAIALALIGPINDWLIFGVGQFVQRRARELGFSKEEAQLHRLRVSVAKLGTESKPAEGIEIEGTADDVITALRLLQGSKDGSEK